MLLKLRVQLIMTVPTTSAAKLKILADRTRLSVMECLLEAPKHVGELAELLKVEQSLLSHHLKVLREAGLVVAIRDGKAVLYRLAPEVESLKEKKVLNLGSYQVLFQRAKQGTD